MYDLKSEDPEEPGLPDEFHILQPRLLDYTLYPPHYPREQIFVGTDINLYYDPQHTSWYKRPDWFAVLGVPELYDHRDLRFSYVTWDEKVNPLILVELLSPATEEEDLGIKLRDAEQPPGKWEVYERILKIPYYAIFDRYKFQFRMFQLSGGRYQEANLSNNRIWLPELELGLGIWVGSFEKQIVQPWLRWYDITGNWVLTREEYQRQRANSEQQRADLEKERADLEKERADSEKQQTNSERLAKEKLISQLRALGIEPNLD
jgi:Uma2 family endonuclease